MSGLEANLSDHVTWTCIESHKKLVHATESCMLQKCALRGVIADMRHLQTPIWLILISFLVFCFVFMPPEGRWKGAGGIMFSGCLSVRTYGNLVTAKSQEPLGGFLSYFAQGCTMTSR